MFNQDIIEILQLTTLGNNASLEEAERRMLIARNTPGFVCELLKLINSDQFELKLRVVAACSLNIETKGNYSEISNEDKRFLWENMIDSITINIDSKSIRKTLQEVLGRMISIDYNTSFAGLSDHIFEKFKSAKSPAEFYGPLFVIKKLVSMQHLALGNERAALRDIIDSCFPLIEELLCHHLDNYGQDKIRNINSALKCFRMANFLVLEQYFSNERLDMWMNIISKVLNLAVDPQLTNKIESWDEIYSRSQQPIWKLKNIATQIISSWNFNSTKSSSKRESADIGALKLLYLKNYSLPFTSVCLGYVRDSFTQYVSPNVVANCIRVLLYGTRSKEMFIEISQFLDEFLLDFTLPLLMLNDKDKQYWNESQADFIYSENSATDDHNIIKNAVTELLESISFKSTGGGCAPYIFTLMNFIVATLASGINARKNTQITPPEEEYLLRALEILHKPAFKHQGIIDKIEDILQVIVIPKLSSEHDIIRARACSVISKYAGLRFDNEDNIKDLCKGICFNMINRPTVVKVRACQALSTSIRHKRVRDIMKDDLGMILQSVISIMNEIELDELLISLEDIIREFSSCIGPYSKELVDKLAESYEHYRNQAISEAENRNVDITLTESIKAADSSLGAIKNIILADLSSEVLSKITPTLLRIFDNALMEETTETLEKCSGFLNILLYSNSSIDDHLLLYYPILCYIVIGKPTVKLQKNIDSLPSTIQVILQKSPLFGQGYVFFEEVLGCFLNFIAKGKGVIIEQTDFFGIGFVDLLLEIIKKLGNECIGSEDDYNLCLSIRLLIGLIENNRGQIDHLIPKILDINSELMRIERGGNLKSLLIQVVCLMFWYNPSMAIQLLTERDYLSGILKVWFGNVQIFTNVLEKERELYGIAGLISLPSELYPKELNISAVAEEVVKVSSEVIKIRGITIKNRQRLLDDENYEDDYEFQMQGDEDDEEFDPNWDEEDDLEAQGTHLIYDSPLELSCPVLLIEDVLKEKESTDVEFFSSFISSLDKAKQNELLRYFAQSKEQLEDRKQNINKLRKRN